MYAAIFGCKAAKDPKHNNNNSDSNKNNNGINSYSNDMNDNVILLRHDISEFTPAEIDALSRLDLPDELESPPQIPDHLNKDMNNKYNKRHKSTTMSTRLHSGSMCTLQQLLPREGRVGGTDSIADAVLSTTQLHVDGRELRNTTAVECFLNLTHLYMQHNHITDLDGITLLQHLSVLVVHHNKVQTLRPLAEMPALTFVDARYNDIAIIDPLQDLPTDTLRYLALLGNPCVPPAATITTTANAVGDVDNDNDSAGAHTNTNTTAFVTAVDSTTNTTSDNVNTDTNANNTITHVEKREAYRRRIMECCPLLEVLDDEPCQSSSSSSISDDSDNDDNNENEKEEETGLSTPRRNREKNPNHTNSPNPNSIIRSRLMRSVEFGKKKQGTSLSTSLPPALAQLRDEHGALTERLCQQFQHRSSSIRRIAEHHARDHPNTEETGWNREDVQSGGSHHYSETHNRRDRSRGDSNNYDDDNNYDETILPASLQQERETKSRLYEDIHFALHTDQARLQQLVGSAWEDVENVMRTRHALVSHRRARMQARQYEPSDSYKESLALLQRESYTEDLDKYRTADLREEGK
ncbi:hypothetical protein LSM04_006249 [Trypanosoma melophagium]|uniref:uncharacterized protein n=1 Tax=Trypanosoma melophagium TaxID=715481 RepID=UPI00351A699A|nr:hypothetical protein LSM04_006249 [Trypanosoma melophagium]